jgi:predicted ATPase
MRSPRLESSPSRVFEHLANARVCVADLSFHNPNAFYELGVRHAFLLPTIQLIHKSKNIPFDVSQGRTITIDTSDSYMVADHLESARKTLSEYVKNLLADSNGPEDNPVAVYLPGVKVTFK